MSKDRPPLIAGNWKMHGLSGSSATFDRIVAHAPAPGTVDVAVFPPLTLLARFAERAGGRVIVGAQDLACGVFGPATGDVSAAMLVDAGARAVIVGHSERRAQHGETDADVRLKAAAALEYGLMTIVCVGESAVDRRDGQALDRVARQLEASLPTSGAGAGEMVVGYEPIWAIGSGLTPTVHDIGQMHAMIRGIVGPDVRILYGGSVNPANAAAILALANVDGALVGGASLDAAAFLAIAACA